MKLSKLFLLVVAALSVTSCGQKHKDEEPYEGTDPATLFDGYYKDLTEWTDYIDLKQKLYNICYKDFAAISYTKDPYTPSLANWTVNRMADQSLYNYDRVNVLYSDYDEYKKTGTTSTWEREHCFPASLMTGKGTGEAVKTIGTATDFHNLYASYESGNSKHSNNSYGNVDPELGEVFTVGNAQYQEAIVGATKRDAVFEPADFDKGRVARAVFYIGLMYGPEDYVHKTDNAGHELSTGIRIVTRESGISCTLGGAERGTKCHSNSEELVEWCRNIWPDRLELQHNNVVQSFQGNRNPFIDFPELVEYLYGEKRLEEGNLKNLHNIYDILDLGNENTANIAVENVKYSYDHGDTFNAANDLTVYAVKNNLEKEAITDYTVSGVTNNAPLSDTQNGSIVSISKDNLKPVNYKLYVASRAWNDANYSGLFTADNVKLSPKPEVIMLNDVGWSFDGGSASSKSRVDDNGHDIGVRVGSGGTPAGTVTIESLSTMCFEDKSIVKGIYIEANSDGSWDGGFTVKMYLDDELVYEKDAPYSSKSRLQTYGVNLSSTQANAGKVKIVFENVRRGLNIGRIGVKLDSTY